MIEVSIDVTGLEEALASLSNLVQVTDDFTPETEAIGEYLIGFFSGDVFDSEGAVYGSGWATLSEPYATYKAKRYGDQKILVATGKMQQGYKLYTATDMLTIKNEATNKDGDFYAGYHQDGTEKMPQRTLIKMDDDRTEKILEILIRSLSERMMSI